MTGYAAARPHRQRSLDEGRVVEGAKQIIAKMKSARIERSEFTDAASTLVDTLKRIYPGEGARLIDALYAFRGCDLPMAIKVDTKKYAEIQSAPNDHGYVLQLGALTADMTRSALRVAENIAAVTIASHVDDDGKSASAGFTTSGVLRVAGEGAAARNPKDLYRIGRRQG